MTDYDRAPDDFLFSPSVRAAQSRLGGRRLYEEARWPVDITRDLEAFIVSQRSVVLASASADGQRYVQHRGGPPGFLRVLDSRTIAMADLRGNRQFVTLGNLAENPRVQLLLIDYAQLRRVKIWGRARMVEGDPDLVARLMPEGLRARADRALVIQVEAWDLNCSQHIPQRLEAADLPKALADHDRRIAELERELAALTLRLPLWEGCGDDLWEE